MKSNPLKLLFGRFEVFRSFAVGFCVFFLASSLAVWLNYSNIRGWAALMDDALAGVTAGLIAFLYECSRQREVEKKLQTIRLMNHHVRNALQVICGASSSLAGSEQGRLIYDAVERIEWALREVLPGEDSQTYAAARAARNRGANLLGVWTRVEPRRSPND